MALWADWTSPDSPVPAWNGLDDIQVSENQRTLTLHFLGKAPNGLRPANVVITSEPGARPVRVLSLRACREQDQELDDCVQLRVDQPGSWTEYRLCLVALDERGRPTPRPFPGLDERLACLNFSFKVNCPSEVDCAPSQTCPPEQFDEPDLNYLARDYGSLRQLLLDRLATVMPQWRERHVPDIGITLVELLAYAGDRFAAAQDAVATEAYLSTARLRTSVRRHARLMDYRLHDGCNARTFVQVQVAAAEHNRRGLPVELNPPDISVSSPDGSRIFEPLLPGAVHWWEVQNEIGLHTWGEDLCVLPRGTTQAALNAGPLTDPLPEGDNPLHLHAGDFLLLEETLGPQTGQPADARPERRQVVRLIRVELAEDLLYEVRVLNVWWAREDALTFDLCLTGRSQPPECRPIRPSVGRGNILLVDHGQTVTEELPPVPYVPVPPSCDECDCGPPADQPGRYRPTLGHAPLTYRQEPQPNSPAAFLLRQDPRRALPDLTLTAPSGIRWLPQADLLESGPDDRHFVVELEQDQSAVVRFGQGGLGRALEAGDGFSARLRVGSGSGGNVGAGTLTRLRLSGQARLPAGVTVILGQPLPAVGGTDPEALDEARRLVPITFQDELKRAVTAEDYATLALSLFPDQVQRAAATLVWSGVGEEIVLAIDALETPDAPEQLLRNVAAALEPYRRAGHDLQVHPARTVGLDLSLDVCVDTHASRAEVRAALLSRFGSGLQPGGIPAYFHPDRLSFAEPVILSRVVAEASLVPGIRSVTVQALRRVDRPHDPALTQGELRLGPTEIARLDNDPHHPSHGLLSLNLRGGR